VSDNLGAKVAGFTVLGLLLLFGVAWAGLYFYTGDTAPHGARVEGISIAGLNTDQAEQRLREALANRVLEPITITYGDGRTTVVDPGSAGLAVDYGTSIDQAGGGSGFGARRMWQLITGGGDHHAEVSVDQSRMQAALDDLGSGIGKPPVEGKVVFRDGHAVPVPSRPGVVVSRGATQSLLERHFLHGGSQKLPTEVRRPETTDAAVRRALEEFARPAMSGPVTLVLGGQQVVAPPQLFGKALSMEAVRGELRPRVDGELLLEALKPVMRTVDREPENARIEVLGGKPRVVPAKVGVDIDPEALADRFARVAVREGAQRRLVVEGQVTPPAFTTAEAQALKVNERVSTFTTRFPYAEYRNINLPRAAELINGTLLRPGETFSLNDVVGERTKANGFTQGYVVDGGIFSMDRGGGVSQIATTAFNAMFLAGLKDVEHTAPPIHVHRFPEGREATVAWPSVDLKLTNTTPDGVLITAKVVKSTPRRQGAATVSMYSTRRWRITSTTGPRTHVTKPGVRQVRGEDCVEFGGRPGFSVNVFRYFRALNSGKVLRKEKFHTDYVAGDKVRCGSPPKPRRN
jgi:vancomycin resistance protein YoaR